LISRFIKKNNISKETIYSPKGSLVFIAILFIGMLVLTLPKIYLSNNIYYISKDINRLHSHYISLKEENKFLIQQLEDAKFKNQITDSLIMQSIDMGIDNTSSNEEVEVVPVVTE